MSKNVPYQKNTFKKLKMPYHKTLKKNLIKKHYQEFYHA